MVRRLILSVLVATKKLRRKRLITKCCVLGIGVEQTYEVGLEGVQSIYCDKEVQAPVLTVKYDDKLLVYKGLPFWYIYQRVQGETK